MPRSRWKVPFVSKIFFMRKFRESISFNTFDRVSFIGPSFLGKRIRVYTGSKFVSFVVRKAMFGKRLGDFSFSKITGRDIYYSMERKRKAKMMKKKKQKKKVR